MKRNLIFPAIAALVVSFSSFSAFAQPGGFRNGTRPVPDYRQNPMPAAPFVIVDGDGRSFNYQNRRFDHYFVQQSLNRKQRKRLERRYGFVPPLVIYVPDRFVNRSGMYVYNNGIVYHRERDGYFHLDDRYFSDRWDDYRDNDKSNYGYEDNHNRGNYGGRN